MYKIVEAINKVYTIIKKCENRWEKGNFAEGTLFNFTGFLLGKIWQRTVILCSWKWYKDWYPKVVKEHWYTFIKQDNHNAYKFGLRILKNLHKQSHIYHQFLFVHTWKPFWDYCKWAFPALRHSFFTNLCLLFNVDRVFIYFC